MERIIPSADLRNHYGDISRQVRESREPMIVTVNGREDTVIMGAAAYRMMTDELALLRALAEAEDDVINGRVAPMEDSYRDIRMMLTEMKAEGRIK